jgi:hypothetical protein
MIMWFSDGVTNGNPILPKVPVRKGDLDTSMDIITLASLLVSIQATDIMR